MQRSQEPKLNSQVRKPARPIGFKSAKDIYANGGTKCCSKCGERKPIDRDHFGSCNGGKNVRGVCRECIRGNSKMHYQKNPGKMKARVRKSEGYRTIKCWSGSEQLSILLRKQNGSCGYCGKKMSQPTVDHKIPVSRGGTDVIQNLIAACKACNCSKGNKTEEEYRSFLSMVS